MVDRLLRRYLWLIDLLRSRGAMTLEEIKGAWQGASINDERIPLSDRTFRNHCSAIQSNLGIEIACRRGRNRNGYYIANPEVLEGEGLNRWLMENYALGAMLSEYRDLSDKILVEDIPSSRDYLTIILSAIRVGRVLCISYCNFVGRGFHMLEFEPLCVKLFKRRWYVLVREAENKDFRILSLDRITSLSITEKPYIYPKDFSPREFFAPYYGIIALTDQPSADIVLRAYDELPGYLCSLPLHTSQEVVQSGSNYTDFKLCLVPTFEFVQELLLHRDQLEVLSPDSLRREMAALIVRMHQRYSHA